MTMTAAELVASKKHILLDFDGPICAAFAGYGASNISRQLSLIMTMEGVAIPADLVDSPDPFALLRYVAELGDPDILAELDSEFRRLEVHAVSVAPPTPYIVEIMKWLVAQGHTLTVVSNNAHEAVHSYANRLGFAALISGVHARVRPDPSLLKPNPSLVLGALEALRSPGSDAVMIGDSPSDVEAARSAEVSCIALSNKPGKRLILRLANPDAIIESMEDITYIHHQYHERN